MSPVNVEKYTYKHLFLLGLLKDTKRNHNIICILNWRNYKIFLEQHTYIRFENCPFTTYYHLRFSIYPFPITGRLKKIEN